MTAGAGASAPGPDAQTGPPQTDEELAEQAARRYAWAQAHHAELTEHAERTRVHVARMVDAERAAADAFAASDLPAAKAAHEAAQARIGGTA